MSPRARKIWDELVSQMASSRVLCETDALALRQLCEDEAMLEEAIEGVWKMAAAMKKGAAERGGKLVGNPIIALLSTTSGRMAMSSVHALAGRVILERREFGLTPSARTRLDVNLPPAGLGGRGEEDPLEMKLCG